MEDPQPAVDETVYLGTLGRGVARPATADDLLRLFGSAQHEGSRQILNSQLFSEFKKARPKIRRATSIARQCAKHGRPIDFLLAETDGFDVHQLLAAISIPEAGMTQEEVSLNEQSVLNGMHERYPVARVDVMTYLAKCITADVIVTNFLRNYNYYVIDRIETLKSAGYTYEIDFASGAHTVEAVIKCDPPQRNPKPAIRPNVKVDWHAALLDRGTHSIHKMVINQLSKHEGCEYVVVGNSEKQVRKAVIAINITNPAYVDASPTLDAYAGPLGGDVCMSKLCAWEYIVKTPNLIMSIHNCANDRIDIILYAEDANIKLPCRRPMYVGTRSKSEVKQKCEQFIRERLKELPFGTVVIHISNAGKPRPGLDIAPYTSILSTVMNEASIQRALYGAAVDDGALMQASGDGSSVDWLEYAGI